jgi:hypothetical protein
MKDDIELGKYPSKKWQAFFEQGNKFSETPIDKWRVAELLCYFANRFQEAFGKEYQWKYNSPTPSKAYEVFRLSTCSSRLSSNPQILVDYIDWIFDQRVLIDKKTFRSISFLTNDEQLQWYRNHILFAGQTDLQIDRSTLLPPNIKEVVGSLGCNTFGDLAFLTKANLDTLELTEARQKLTDIKFDFDVLNKIV